MGVMVLLGLGEIFGIRTDNSQEFQYEETQEKHKDERKSGEK